MQSFRRHWMLAAHEQPLRAALSKRAGALGLEAVGQYVETQLGCSL
jgi:hypothetical protein